MLRETYKTYINTYKYTNIHSYIVMIIDGDYDNDENSTRDECRIILQ